MSTKKTNAKKKNPRTKPIRRRANRRANGRRSPRLTGHGGYESVGGQIGSNLGGFIGHGIQQLVKSITGFGDYRVGSNSLMPGLQPPELVNSSKERVTLRHREYIADVFGTNAFTVTTYPINPGLSNTFPWLAAVAAAFEEYIVSGMIFEFKSLSADYTANTSLGSVVMATEYNVLLPAFPDKKTMENYEFANSAKISDCFIHPIECAFGLTPVHELFVRTGAPPAGSDTRLFDLGNFQIATAGNPITTAIGELWCTYEIQLTKPKAGALNLGYVIATDHFQLGTVTNVAPLGTTSVLQKNSTIGSVLGLGKTIQFPLSYTDGAYLFVTSWSGGSAAYVPSVITPVNCVLDFIFAGDLSSFIPAPQSGGTCTTAALIFIVTITATGATVTYGSATLPTSVTSGDLWITELNSAITT